MDQTIARIAEALGFQAARIWPQVVMVTWVTSLFWSIVDPIIIVGGIVGIARLWRYGRTIVDTANAKFDKAQENARGYTSVSRFDYDPTGPVMICVGAALCLGFLAFLALIGLPDQLAGALYPEATTVLRIAKGLK